MQEILYPQLRVAICDDREEDRRVIEKMVFRILAQEQFNLTISCYESAAQVLEAVQAGEVFHIFLLDVMLLEMDGVTLASKLRSQNNDAAIILMSVSREMALRGYEVAAARYLVKPLEEDRLREALLFCCKPLTKQKKLLLFTAKGQSVIDPAAILYAESENRGVLLTLITGQIFVSIKMTDLANLLPKNQYVFCHRTTLVNLEFVDHLRHSELEMKDGRKLPVSKYRFAELQERLLLYMNI